MFRKVYKKYVIKRVNLITNINGNNQNIIIRYTNQNMYVRTCTSTYITQSQITF